MIIQFDVDGTLITMQDTPRYEVIDLLRWFLNRGHRIVIASGGGRDYADHWARKLFGDDPIDSGKIIVSEKTAEAAQQLKPDIVVDDEMVQLGRVNIQV